MEGHDSLLLGWYPTPTTPAYPSVDLPPGPQAPSTSNLVRLPPSDYPDLRTPIIQQHEPGETNAAGAATGGTNSAGQTGGVSAVASTAGSGGGSSGNNVEQNEATVVNIVGRMGSASGHQLQHQHPTLHLSSHHIVTPSVTQLQVAQAGTATAMLGVGASANTGQLGGQAAGTQVLQQVVAQTPGGGHQLVHMVLHHGGTSQTSNAATAVSMGGTLQIGGLTSVGTGVTVQALTSGVGPGALSTGGIVNVNSLGVLETGESVGVEGGPPFRCEECGHVAKTKRMLKRHLATVHSQERNYACPYCDAKYKSRSGLRVHSIKHNVGKHKCDVCDKLFPYKGALEEHMKVIHEDFRFRCTWDGCEFSTTSKYLLKGHVSYNHEGGKYVDNKFRKKCRFCEYIGYDIRGHESAMHGLEPRFECPTCGKKFHFGSNLRQHKKVHLPLDQYPFVCDVCGDRFLRRRQLEDHFIGKHTNEKPHLCVKCGFSCASRRTMSDHAAANCYEKEAAMRCKFCAFETKIPFTMRTHKEECHPKHTVKRKKQRKAWQSDSDDDGEGEEGPDEEEEEVANAEQLPPGAQKMARKRASKIVYMPWSVKPDQGGSDEDLGDEVEEAPTAFVKQELLDEVMAQTGSTSQPPASTIEQTEAISMEVPTAAAETGTALPNLPRKRGRPPGSRNGQTVRKLANQAVPAISPLPSLKVTLKPIKPAKQTARVAKRKKVKKRVSRKRRRSSSDELSDVDEPEMSDLDDEDHDEFEEAKLLRELEEKNSDDDSMKRRSTRQRKLRTWKTGSSATFGDNPYRQQQIHKKKQKTAEESRQSVSRKARAVETIKKEKLISSQQFVGEAMCRAPTTGGKTVMSDTGSEQSAPGSLVPKRRGRPPKRKAALAVLERTEETHDDFMFDEHLQLEQPSISSGRKPTIKKIGEKSEESIITKTLASAGRNAQDEWQSKTQNQTYEKIVNDDDYAVCGKLFSTPFRLKQHTLLAHQDFRFACGYDGCDYKSKYQQQLNKHVRLKHLGIEMGVASGRRKCTMCDFEGYCLAAHVRAVHTKEKPYKCQHCDRAFSDRNNQRAHEHRVHAKERLKHKCSFCDQMFYTPGRLREHVAVRHTHEHTHLCENCGFSTAVERTYLRHRKSNCNFHETPLKCPRCDFSTHIPFLFKTHKAVCEVGSEGIDTGAASVKGKQPLRSGVRLRKVKLKSAEQDMPWEEGGEVTDEAGNKAIRVKITLPAKKRGRKSAVKDQKKKWTTSEDDVDDTNKSDLISEVAQMEKKARTQTMSGVDQKKIKTKQHFLLKADCIEQEMEKIPYVEPRRQREPKRVATSKRVQVKRKYPRETQPPTKRRSTRVGMSTISRNTYTVESDSDYVPDEVRVSKLSLKRKAATGKSIKNKYCHKPGPESLAEVQLPTQPLDGVWTEATAVKASSPPGQDNCHQFVDTLMNIKDEVTDNVEIIIQPCGLEESDGVCGSYDDTNAAENGHYSQGEEMKVECVDNDDAIDGEVEQVEEVEMFACPQCDTFFVDQIKFASHIVQAHVNKVKIRVGSKEWKKAHQLNS
ncbi:hypothetical protein BIW11_04454 [Tropilaelaps mercedesae]|uniref:C2H2-type domain-containing protein n=1 Tax=Tropilaelaps mercedesae TaxID=418985 RepID=A0A1V9X613_9ACAR|nr:hypothetical protein BIW11_04454 [Tropilaelaps mercedesae]